MPQKEDFTGTDAFRLKAALHVHIKAAALNHKAFDVEILDVPDDGDGAYLAAFICSKCMHVFTFNVYDVSGEPVFSTGMIGGPIDPHLTSSLSSYFNNICEPMKS
jgi:hypothetical protein